MTRYYAVARQIFPDVFPQELPISFESEEEFDELVEVLHDYAGKTKCNVLHGGKRYAVAVNPSRGLLAELRMILPPEAVKFV